MSSFIRERTWLPPCGHRPSLSQKIQVEVFQQKSIYQAQSWTLTMNVDCSWWIVWRMFMSKEQREASSNNSRECGPGW
jgi:hypothetical protein